MTDELLSDLKDRPALQNALDWFAQRNIQLIISQNENYIEVRAFTSNKETTGYAFDGDVLKGLRATARRWLDGSKSSSLGHPEKNERHPTKQTKKGGQRIW